MVHEAKMLQLVDFLDAEVPGPSANEEGIGPPECAGLFS